MRDWLINRSFKLATSFLEQSVMTINSRTFLTTILLTIILAGCSEEKIPTMFVDPELQPFFILFQEEALNRGLVVNLESVGGVVKEIQGTEVIGHCSSEEGARNVITIDQFRWSNLDDLSKQYIIFHELGHCALDRDHFDDRDNEGNCESLMHSIFERCIDDFTTSTRSAYLDELFLIR